MARNGCHGQDLPLLYAQPVPTMPHTLRLVPLFLAAILSGCGFHLRGAASVRLAPEIATLRVLSAEPGHPPLAVELRRALREQAGATVTESAGAPVLSVSGEGLDVQVLAIDSAGRVSAYLLNYATVFELRGAAGQSLLPAQSVKLQRELGFDKLSVLAKEREDELLRREMRDDAVQQILRRLAAWRPAAPPAAR